MKKRISFETNNRYRGPVSLSRVFEMFTSGGLRRANVETRSRGLAVVSLNGYVRATQ
jgi:hypothetical protein